MAPRTDHISVIVQGPLAGRPGNAPETRLTEKTLQSIRRHLPGAEIVLSTWKGSDPSGMDFDRFVESDDPGALPYTDFPDLRNNVNRQIVSTRAGLLRASRPFALKLRSDMLLRSAGFLDFFDRFPRRSTASILESKVVTCTMYSRLAYFGPVTHPPPWDRKPGEPTRDVKFGWPYHPSDWFHFGRLQDVVSIWDVPLAPEPQDSRWFVGRPRPLNDPGPHSMNRFTPEQHVWLSFLRKHRAVDFEHKWDVREETIEGTERSFASDLVLVTPAQAGVVFAKYRPPSLARGPMDWLVNGAGSCYTYGMWKELYRRHCCDSPPALALPALRRASLRTAYRLLVTSMALRVRIAKARGRVPS